MSLLKLTTPPDKNDLHFDFHQFTTHVASHRVTSPAHQWSNRSFRYGLSIVSAAWLTKTASSRQSSLLRLPQPSLRTQSLAPTRRSIPIPPCRRHRTMFPTERQGTVPRNKYQLLTIGHSNMDPGQLSVCKTSYCISYSRQGTKY
jgi:hypothetical protein